MPLLPALSGCVLCLAAQAGQDHFSPRDALRAEWARRAPAVTEAQKAALPPADRARLEQSLARIGAPGAPALLPADWEKPLEAAWLRHAAEARTPRERFDALFFLNRLKSPKALAALAGLRPGDAAAWPRHLHLESLLAAARLNGCEPSPELQAFLDALQKAGKVDPVRAQAARLRLVMAGKEPALLPPVPATPGAILALMDAWNRAPWEQRKGLALSAFRNLSPASPAWAALGLAKPSQSCMDRACVGILARLGEGTPDPAPRELLEASGQPWACAADPLALWYGAQVLPRFPELPPAQRNAMERLAEEARQQPVLAGALLPALRKHAPAAADRLRAALLEGPSPIARAAAIDDLAAAPIDLEVLIQRLWKVEEYDGVQVLLASLGKWKLPEAPRKALLARFLEHPCWTARLDAHTQLAKLDPSAPWPAAPAPTAEDRAQLALAEELAAKGLPVRLRLHFSGRRQVTLRLDPGNAPLNVANLVRLAGKGFFNGRRVPRVVPDFVVQMGSPSDTMDGGPGYTVRCENSLAWYGPGSVGMALSGKDTGGSQFFITLNAAPHLTGRYTRVGEVEDPDRALPLLDQLELGATLEKAEVLPLR